MDASVERGFILAVIPSINNAHVVVQNYSAWCSRTRTLVAGRCVVVIMDAEHYFVHLRLRLRHAYERSTQVELVEPAADRRTTARMRKSKYYSASAYRETVVEEQRARSGATENFFEGMRRVHVN